MKPFRLFVPLLLLGGCDAATPAPQSLHATAAEWRSFAIEGIAPLMSERDVVVELARRNYQPRPCAAAGKPGDLPPENAMSSCYLRDGRWSLFLNFEGAGQDRVLTWMRLYDQRSVFATKEANLAQSRRYAEALTRRFGPADEIVETGFTHYYWYVPRGIDRRAPGRLHDSVSITILPTPGLNVTLSGWKPPSSTER